MEELLDAVMPVVLEILAGLAVIGIWFMVVCLLFGPPTRR